MLAFEGAGSDAYPSARPVFMAEKGLKQAGSVFFR